MALAGTPIFTTYRPCYPVGSQTFKGPPTGMSPAWPKKSVYGRIEFYCPQLSARIPMSFKTKVGFLCQGVKIGEKMLFYDFSSFYWREKKTPQLWVGKKPPFWFNQNWGRERTLWPKKKKNGPSFTLAQKWKKERDLQERWVGHKICNV